ncbi:ATP-binding cassette domain-containing protein, partial [Saccharothrix algeriensis]
GHHPAGGDPCLGLPLPRPRTRRPGAVPGPTRRDPAGPRPRVAAHRRRDHPQRPAPGSPRRRHRLPRRCHRSRQPHRRQHRRHVQALRGHPADAGRQKPAALTGIAVCGRRRPAALESVDLTDRRDSRISRLSGGMRRRVGIAQAVVNWPGLLLLDEPTVGLDPRQRRGLHELIPELARDRAVVLSTHLTEDVAAMADRIVVLDGGVVRFDGTVEEFTGGEGSGAARIDSAYEALVMSGDDR